MPAIDFVVETPVSRSSRARQLEAMFDVPPGEKSRREWKGELLIDAGDWNVGLIVGPSGSGKTQIGRQVFAANFQPEIAWGAASVIDDFSRSLSMEQISGACQAVGFNTIPAWLRPFHVLSNGEKFRVEIARRILELPDPIVIDEFTSVVDRQVAQVGSHAVQKFVRRNNRKLVALSCHYDIIDWLQPDWIFEPATMHFARRCLQRRPAIDIVIGRVPYSAWRIFAPFHYMSAELNRSARCFGLWANGALAAFCGVLNRPHPKVRNLRGISRIVTLPDWQGLGLAFVLAETLGAAYRGVGMRFRNYPAHPAFVRAHRLDRWSLAKKPGRFSPPNRANQSAGVKSERTKGGRPCAVFEFVGAPMERQQAARLLSVG